MGLIKILHYFIPGRQMKIGYARISTQDQSLDQQIKDLRNAGCEEVLTDVASGASVKRPGFDQALKLLRAGDTLIVWKLDRLGKSLSHLVKTVEELGARQVLFLSLNDPIDTTTASGKLVFGIFAALAEFELGLIRERTEAGLRAARARGRTGGRKPVLTKSQALTLRTLHDSKKHSVTEVCRQLCISRKTYYNYLNKGKNPTITALQTD